MKKQTKKGVIQLSAWALGILSCILIFSSPAAADYVCWPFGGVDQLIFPSCTTSGGHRQMDVNVVSAVAPAPAGTQQVDLVKVGGSAFAQGQRTSANSISTAPASDGIWTVIFSVAQHVIIDSSSVIHTIVDSGTVTIGAGAAVIGHVIVDAGTAIIGKVTTDQTTPGTTDLVHAKLCDAMTPTQCGAVSAGGAQKVDNSGVTQPVSGTVTSNQGGTWAVNFQDTNGSPIISCTHGIQQGIAAGTIVTATTTAVVQGANVSSHDYLCKVDIWINSGTNVTWALVAGTQGTSCSSPTTIIPANSLNYSSWGMPLIDSFNAAGVTNASVCIVTTGTLPSVGYSITWSD